MGDDVTHSVGSRNLAPAEFLSSVPGNPAIPAPPTPHASTFQADPPASNFENPTLLSAYLEQLLECTPEAVSILDQEQRIQRVNGEFTRMFGFSPEEAVG